ncbi:hypothetical protein ACI3EY_16075 [Ornithinimicrobium sp. LYQ92]|uniref:hypothetical protein n=1 Tax=Serinicoccus sp. LYQ92 TaxID=3378798 RepID=UPI0038550AEB
MTRRHDSSRPPSRGEGALLAGVVALLFVIVPVIGDVVAVPVALVAVVLGLRGYLREEAGSSWRYVVGAAAGLFSLFAILLMIAATGLP